MITIIIIVAVLTVGGLLWYLRSKSNRETNNVSIITTSTTTSTTTAMPQTVPIVNVNLQPAYGVVISRIEGLREQATQTWPIESPVSYKALYLSNELFVTVSKVPVQSLGLTVSVNETLHSTVHINEVGMYVLDINTSIQDGDTITIGVVGLN